MIGAASDGVNRISPTIAPVQDRRDPRRRQREFPAIDDDEDGGSEEPPRAPEPEGSRKPPEHDPAREDEDSGHIDIRVLGRVLPTRQFLPAQPGAASPH